MQKTLAIAFVALLAFASTQAAESLQQFVNDNHVLNYALTLENLEAQLYSQGLTKFSSDDNFTTAGFPAGTFATLSFIGSQEAGHAQSLTSVLGARGWPAVPKCTYNFTNALFNVTTFVDTLYAVENLGTSAYDGASSYITNSFLLTIAAGIATVEARHTALLAIIANPASVNNVSTAPFPNNLEPASSFTDVFGQVQANGFIASCPSSPASGNQTISYYPAGWSVSSSNPNTFPLQPAINFKNSSITTGPLYYNTAGAGPAIQASDLMVIQYALTLENLEAFFYNNFSDAYSSTAVLAAYPTLSANAAALLSESIATISAHEQYHVSLLSSLISTHGGSPNTACTYNFSGLGLPYGSQDFSLFLSAASALENTGVSAYIGAIGLIANPNVAQVGATIATVEARHASFIADVLNNTGNIYGSNVDSGATGNVALVDPILVAMQASLPLNNDNGVSPAAVYTKITTGLGLITGCPTTNGPFYGQPNQPTFVNFFSDNGATNSPTEQLSPFVVVAGTTSATGTTTTTTTTNPNGTPTTTVTGTTKSSSSTITAAFAMIAMLVFLL